MKLKTTFEDVCATFRAHNESNGISYGDSSHADIKAYIVYKKCNFTLDYSEAERTYVINNRSGKAFFKTPSGSQSMYGYSLDGSDCGVRLDKYDWEIEYCYFNAEDFNNSTVNETVNEEDALLLKAIKILLKRCKYQNSEKTLLDVIDNLCYYEDVFVGLPICENCKYAVMKNGEFEDCVKTLKEDAHYCRNVFLDLVKKGVIK